MDNFNQEEDIIILLDDEEEVIIPEEVEESESIPVTPSVKPAAAPGSRYRVEIEDDEDDDDYDYDDDEEGLWGSIAGKLLLGMGIVIAVLAIVVGIKMLGGKRETSEKVDFSTLGNNIAAVGTIGGDNVSNITKAQGTKLEELADAIINYDYEEADEETGVVSVDITLTTILKDLKIKFVNRKDKLIGKVPFKVEITQPDGKTITVADEDRDGIIYLSEIPGGSYSVKMLSLDGYDAYYDFNSCGTKSVTVKTQLDYKKVDVKNEIKTATEEESKKEDTSVNETVEESKLKDTVDYVSTAKTETDGGYELIDRANVVDPVTTLKKSVETAMASRFMMLADGDGTDPAPTHIHSLGAPQSNGDGTHTLSCSDPSCDHSAGDSKTEACTDDGSGKCLVCGGTMPQQQCTHANLKCETVSATSHKVICKDCNDTVKTEETCEWDGNGKCTKASLGCTNEKKAEFSVTSCSISYDGYEKVTYSSSDKDKKYKLVLNATYSDESQIDYVVYSWKKNSGAPIAYVGYDNNTDDIKNDKSIQFTVSQIGKTNIQCDVKIHLKNGNTVSTYATKEISVEGIEIKVPSDKIVAFCGIESVVELKPEVIGGTTGKLNWYIDSSDYNKVSVAASEDTKSAKIQGKATGNVVLTITSADDNTVVKKVTIVIYQHPSVDKSTKLTDKDGNALYVKDGEKYRAATYYDYYHTEKLYKGGKTAYKYTGWWTIDGKTYYYDSNGKKVTGEQVILGAKYTFSSEGVLQNGNAAFGIDVSVWNGTIDWKKVKNSGVTYAIIRCGFRGSTQGGLYSDNKFAANIKNATDAGIKVGVYFFTQAVNEAEAIEEASMCISLVENYKLAYPIFIDVESSGGRADKLNSTERTNIIKAFCKTVANSGYKAGVYANKNWFTNKINAAELTGYTIWLAQYASQPTYTTTRYDMWQYSAKGTIDGISGDVDLNLSYLGY